MKLMLAYLWEGEYTKEELSYQLIHSVARIKTVSENSQVLAKLRQKFKDLSNKFQDTRLTTKSHEQWTAFGVFQRAGIEVKMQDVSAYFKWCCS